MSPNGPTDREPDDPLYSDEYYELLERLFGEEKAAWARLPRAEREKELTRLHAQYNTPDDLDVWPPELGGGRFNP
jgi:hypothetical protein